MKVQKLQQETVQYGASLSILNASNIDTGFLTMQRTTPLENEQLIALSSETEQILVQFTDAFSNVSLNGYDSATIVFGAKHSGDSLLINKTMNLNS